MDAVFTGVAVTALCMVIAAAAGYRLSRSAGTYGPLNLLLHMALFMLVSSGVFASIYRLHSLEKSLLPAALALYVAALTLLVNLAVGVAMIAATQRDPRLISIHQWSSAGMAAALIASLLLLAKAS